jgi:hypothetical protein
MKEVVFKFDDAAYLCRYGKTKGEIFCMTALPGKGNADTPDHLIRHGVDERTIHFVCGGFHAGRKLGAKEASGGKS